MEQEDVDKHIQKLAGTYLKDIVSVLICTVDSVDKDNRVFDCTPVNGDANTSIPGVQLCAENNNGFLVFPEVGSTVIVALTTRQTAFLLLPSDITNAQFMDGTFGGMVKVIQLTQKVNALENLINDLVVKFNAHTHITACGAGAGSAAPTLTPATTVIVPTQQSEIENILGNHGNI